MRNISSLLFFVLIVVLGYSVKAGIFEGFPFKVKNKPSSNKKSINNLRKKNFLPTLRLPKLLTAYSVLLLSTTFAIHKYIDPKFSVAYGMSMLTSYFSTVARFCVSGGSTIPRRMGGRNAKQVDVELYNIVQNIAKASDLPPIESVWIIPDQSRNAFAAGIFKNKACVAVTKGLRDTLTLAELKVSILVISISNQKRFLP
jgi:Zn-dependent protease with chaperone function